jgi:hypothetical protein
VPDDIIAREQQPLADELYRNFPPDNFLGNPCGTPDLAVRMLNAHGWDAFVYNIPAWDLAGVDTNGANSNLVQYLTFLRQGAIDPVPNTITGAVAPPHPVLCLVDVSSWPNAKQDPKVAGMHWVAWEAADVLRYPFPANYYLSNVPWPHQQYVPARMSGFDFAYSWENRFVIGYPKFIAVLPRKRA